MKEKNQSRAMDSLTQDAETGGNWKKIMGEKHTEGLLNAKEPHSTQQVPVLVTLGMGQSIKGGRLICLSCFCSQGVDINVMSFLDFFFFSQADWLSSFKQASAPSASWASSGVTFGTRPVFQEITSAALPVVWSPPEHRHGEGSLLHPGKQSREQGRQKDRRWGRGRGKFL